jgi:hypothetical protein
VDIRTRGTAEPRWTTREVFPNAGHFPHLDDPLRFVRVLGDFIDTTQPARVDAAGWGKVLRGGGHRPAAARAKARAHRAAGR